MYRWALLLHLVGVIVYFGGLLVAAVAQLSARRATRPVEIAAVLGVARSGAALVGGGLLALVVGGIWLVSETPWPTDTWLPLSVALLVVALVTGGLGGRTPRHARQLATRLGAADAPTATPELRALLDDRPSALLNAVAALASVAVLVLMIWKPGA